MLGDLLDLRPGDRIRVDRWLVVWSDATVLVAFLYWRSTFAHPRLLEPISVLVRAGRGRIGEPAGRLSTAAVPYHQGLR